MLVLLMSRLTRARAGNRLESALQQLSYLKLLILDEIGYLPLTREDASLIVTSNKSFIDWGEIVGDHGLATAILDRLLHHASMLNIKGDSFRLKEKRRAGLLGRSPSTPAPTPRESHADSPIHGPLADLDS